MSDQARTGELTLLSTLLTPSRSSTEASPPPSSSIDDALIGKALQADIQRHLRAGWKWNPPFLEKGTVQARPSARLSFKTPADRSFNPAKDAFVLYMGGRYLGNYLYEWGGLTCRHDGSLIDLEETFPGEFREVCRECLGYPWSVKVPRRRRIPTAKPWESDYTYCRRCVTSEEIEDLKRRQAATPPQKRRLR